jgi:outer membrane receptor protein involved in Fe transport
VSITTKSGGNNFFGSLKGITSEVLDDYGYNLASASLGGPVLGDFLSFFVAGEYIDQKQRRPFAIDVPRLRDDRIEALKQNPTSLPFEGPDGETVYVPIPGDIGCESVSGGGIECGPVGFNEVLAALEYPEGVSAENLLSNDPVFGAEVEPVENYEFLPTYPNHSSTTLRLNGNVTLGLSDAIRVRLTGRYQNWEYKREDANEMRRTVFNFDRFRNDDNRTYGFGGSWTHRLSNSTFYQLQVDYSDYRRRIYDPSFSDDVRDILSYGDVSHPANITAQRYKVLSPDFAEDSLYVPQFVDGSLPGNEVIYNVLAAPGAGDQTYQSQDETQFRISANATTQIGINQIEFGGEFEQRTERFYWVPGGRAGHTTLAALDVERWEDLTFGQVRGIGAGIRYWGYDYLGVTETDTENVDDFVTGDDPNRSTRPYEPIYYAGYIQDKIELNDLVLNLGLRVDVFDDNGLVIKDIWAMVPIVRAGDAESGGGHPSNIGDDFAVYFNAAGEPVGYRDTQGNWFDAGGQDSNGRDVTNLGQPRVPEGKEGRLSSEVFEDYEPQVTWMPRIGVSFPVTDQALFFAHYDVTQQRPFEFEHEGLNQLLLAQETGQTRAWATGLKPVKTTEYEIGFRQRLGARSAFTVSGFYKKIDDLIQILTPFFGFPGGFGYYQNSDFGTVKGVTFEYDLRRTNNVSLNANYTLSFADGTGSDGQTTIQIQWRGTSNDDFPNFISPLDFDRRHSINAALDYRLGAGEGPTIGGATFLEHFGFNLVGSFRSGQPYTALKAPNSIRTGSNEGPTGAINNESIPWSTLLNLRVDRRFPLGSGGASFTAFLWIQNLLNADNTLNVYGATGLPGNDGYIASPRGQQFLQAQEIPENAAALYGFRINDPFNYGIPRLARLGLRFNF